MTLVTQKSSHSNLKNKAAQLIRVSSALVQLPEKPCSDGHSESERKRGVHEERAAAGVLGSVEGKSVNKRRIGPLLKGRVGKRKGGAGLTSWLGILLMSEAGGVPVRRIICCSWFISKASESRGIAAWSSAESMGAYGGNLGNKSKEQKCI